MSKSLKTNSSIHIIKLNNTVLGTEYTSRKYCAGIDPVSCMRQEK